MLKTRWFFVFLLAVVFVPGCVFITLPTVQPLTEKIIGGEGRDKVLLMDISGIITDKADQSRLTGFRTTPNLTARIKEELTKASKDELVGAVVLRINSPGGNVTTCDVIVHEIRKFKKEKNIPVVAELMDVAASGGYYIASAADVIVAHPTTVTGSIGVVAYNVDATGLLNKIGISNQTIKSGDKKDMGSPLRSMTDEERRIIQSVIDAMYERFLDVVIDGRGPLITREELRRAADGRIYTSGQALDMKLIDRIGYLDDAVELAREKAGLEEATIVTYAHPSDYRNNIYSAFTPSAGAGMPSTVNLINIDAAPLTDRLGLSFMYIWLP